MSSERDLANMTLYPEIKLFIASSSQLKAERDRCALALFDLSEHQQGNSPIRLAPQRWEEMDAAISQRKHKNHDYVAVGVECEIFIALLDGEIGKYTQEELNTALSGHTTSGLPHKIIILNKKSTIQTRAKHTSTSSNVYDIDFDSTDEMLLELLAILIPYLREKSPSLNITVQEQEGCTIIAGEIIIHHALLSKLPPKTAAHDYILHKLGLG